jgi:hypothetical protein
MRLTTLSVAGLLAAFALGGCSLLPSTETPQIAPTQATVVATVKADELADTTWSGTDSAQIPTTFTLHKTGSTAVTFGSSPPYDDPADTWTLDGNTLTVTINNITGEGDASYTGQVTSADGPIDLAVTFTLDATPRTLTVTKAAK